MTRKAYQNKMRYFMTQALKQADEHLRQTDPNYVPAKIGRGIRQTLDHSKEVAERFGSYQAAWDSIAEVRKFFGVEC